MIPTFILLTMKYQIDDAFISQLFAHPSFLTRLRRSQPVPPPPPPFNPTQGIVEEICIMLTQEFRQRVEGECHSLCKSHLQALKEIDQIKSSLSLLNIQSEQSLKDHSLDSSILSKCGNDLSPVHGKREGKCGSTSFMSSFLFEEKGKEDLQELIGTRMASLTGDLSRFESAVQERLRNVEGSLTRKMESIYKTLTSVFESINDLQTKYSEIRNTRETVRQQPRKDRTQKPLEVRPKTSRDNGEAKETKEVKDGDGGNRRRSFMGFLKY